MKTMKTEKRMVEVEVPVFETTGEGSYDSLLGKYCYIRCCNYAYSGTVSAVNGVVLEISNPEIVYETGTWSAKKWANAEKLPTNVLKLSFASIEAAFEVLGR